MTVTGSRDWDKRYQRGGLRASGTFDHTEAGNAQFYRAKCDALDHCLSAVSAGFGGKRVLDAAGGTGQFVPYYLKNGGRHVTVADYSEVALQQIRQRWKDDSRVETVLMDLSEYLPEVAQKPYDFVLVQEAIFLLPDDNALRNAIANLGRYLLPGGYLILSDLFPEERIVASASVVRRPRAMFEELLTQNGLQVITYIPQTVLFNRAVFGRAQFIIEQLGPFYYWLDRIAQRRGMKPSPGKDIKYLVARKQ